MKYRFRLSQVVYYDITVDAKSREEALRSVEEMIDSGEIEDADTTEVDSGAMALDNYVGQG